MAIDPTKVRDVVIVVPGIMGSELVDARGNRIWSVSAGALVNAIRTLGKSLRRLQLPAGIGDNRPDDGVSATALLTSLHVIPGLWSPITGYDGLLNFLRSPRFQLVEADPRDTRVIPNLISFPYDWRLSNRFNGRLLTRVAVEALERWRAQPGMGEAKLVLICHSMGGLVARWFAEQEGGAELIRALITIGTPHRGALKALTNLVNGLEPGIGPLRIPLTELVRSLPSLYQMLPQYDCLVSEFGRTRLCKEPAVGLDARMLADAHSMRQSRAPRRCPTNCTRSSAFVSRRRQPRGSPGRRSCHWSRLTTRIKAVTGRCLSSRQSRSPGVVKLCIRSPTSMVSCKARARFLTSWTAFFRVKT
jgi:pimeloyl-ACP methyl ester carboxylesterase